MSIDLNAVITWFKDSIMQNQFAQGGFALMLIGFIVAYLRWIPGWIASRLSRHFSTYVEVEEKDEVYEIIQVWLNSNYKDYRRVALKSSYRKIDDPNVRKVNDDHGSKMNIYVVPSYGTHFMFWKKKLVVFSKEKRDAAGGPNSAVSSFLKAEFTSFRIFTRDKKVIGQFLDEAVKLTLRDTDKIAIKFPSSHDDVWRKGEPIVRRPIASIILADGIMDSLIGDIEEFTKSRKWHEDRGIPYRRGYLLYGPPGNGKTTIVQGIANHFNMSIHVLHLAAKSISDTRLNQLFSSVQENSIVLIEDIDCIFKKRDTEAEDNTQKSSLEALTMSGLLNAIDGVAASESRIVFMTTNFPELLDAALTRPGRVDMKILIGNATKSQAMRIFKRFYPETSDDDAERFGNLVGNEKYSMAKIQGLLIAYKTNPEGAISNAIEFMDTETFVASNEILEITKHSGSYPEEDDEL